MSADDACWACEALLCMRRITVKGEVCFIPMFLWRSLASSKVETWTLLHFRPRSSHVKISTRFHVTHSSTCREFTPPPKRKTEEEAATPHGDSADFVFCVFHVRTTTATKTRTYRFLSAIYSPHESAELFSVPQMHSSTVVARAHRAGVLWELVFAFMWRFTAKASLRQI